LLLAATATALRWGNSPRSESYEQVWAAQAAISIGERAPSMDLARWVSEGLMTRFLFVVGPAPSTCRCPTSRSTCSTRHLTAVERRALRVGTDHLDGVVVLARLRLHVYARGSPVVQLEDLSTELCRNPTRILLAFTAPRDANRNWPLGGGRAGTFRESPSPRCPASPSGWCPINRPVSPALLDSDHRRGGGT
jgi:Na+/H+ antiporter 1